MKKVIVFLLFLTQNYIINTNLLDLTTINMPKIDSVLDRDKIKINDVNRLFRINPQSRCILVALLPSNDEYVVIANKDDFVLASELFDVDLWKLPFYLILNPQNYSQLAELPLFQGFVVPQRNNNVLVEILPD